MSKLELDKYYTSDELAKYCIDKTYEIIGHDNISEVIEPSAGLGAFSNQIEGCMAYDIEPDNPNIIKQDYLSLELEYLKGRLIIGNPPYGSRNTLSVRFFKKSIQIADYISFISSISQLNNNIQMYEFDLVYSEDLGEKLYTDRKLRCCLNIYKRPENGLNPKPNYKLKDIEIREQRRNGQQIDDFEYDIGICGGGSGIIGKIPQYIGQYRNEKYIKIHNKQFKDKVIYLVKNTNWEKEVCNGISGQNGLYQWQIYKYIKENIIGIQ